MPLQKQNIQIPFRGLNTKIDPKQEPVGDFTQLKNITFRKQGELSKRYGYEALSTLGVNNLDVDSPLGLADFKNQPLMLAKGQAYSYSDAAEAWSSEGNYHTLVPESTVVYSPQVDIGQFNAAYAGGFGVYIWKHPTNVAGTTNDLKITVEDLSSNARIVDAVSIPLSTGATLTYNNLRIESFKGLIYIFYTRSNSLYCRQFNVSYYAKGLATWADKSSTVTGAFTPETGANAIKTGTGTEFTTEVGNLFDASTIGANDYLYDVGASNNYCNVVATVPSTGTDSQVAWVKIDSNAELSTKLTENLYKPTTAIDLQIEGGALLTLSWAENNAAYFNTYNESKDLMLNKITVTTASPTQINTITTRIDPVSTFYCSFMTNFYTNTEVETWTSTGSTTATSTTAAYRYPFSQFRTYCYQYDSGTSTGTGVQIARGSGVVSKCLVADGQMYALIVRDSEFQPTYFLVDKDGSVHAKLSENEAGPIFNHDRIRSTGTALPEPNIVTSLPQMSTITDTSYLVATMKKTFLKSNEGTFYSLLGVNSSVINVDESVANQSANLADNTHLAGGILKLYDGNKITEHGFNYYPPLLLKIASTFTGSTGTAIHSVFYKAIYTWTDAQGNIHKSAPSRLLQVSGTAGQDTFDNAKIAVPTLSITDKGASSVNIELYRTAVGGTTYYHATTTTSATSPRPNNANVDWIIMDDALSDSNLISQEFLYTTGGILDNIPPVSNSIVTSYKNRLFIAGLEDKLELMYSKIKLEKEPIAFNDTLTVLVDQKGGDIVALQAMDDKLIIFKENAIFFMAGDGPLNTGEQDNFTEPQLVSGDVGLKVKNTVVLTALGIFFVSIKGIYLLTRGLALQYIGAPVEDFMNLTFTKSEAVIKHNEIRFLTSDGVTLVFNYFLGLWTSFDNHQGISSRIINEDYYYINNEGVKPLIYKENTTFVDNGSPVNMSFETGWMSFGGVQGYQRVYRLLLLGDYISEHKLKIEIAYDYRDSYVQEETLTFGNIDTSTTTGVDIETYTYGGPLSPGVYGDPGSSTSYATATTYGGENALQYQIKVNMKKQKCQAIKLKITNQQTGAEVGEGLTISNLMFVVGVKGTDGKIKQSRVFGVS